MPKEATAKRGAAKKAEKPKSKAKRGLSAYMFYSQDKRQEVKEKNPDATFGQIGKILGADWKKLTDEEKKPYNDKAAADKERYEKEKAAEADK